MVIAIDVRSLHEQVGGVPEYTRALIQALLESEQKHFYVLFSSGLKDRSLHDIPTQGPHHRWCRVRIPNKILHASVWLTGHPRFEQLIRNAAGVRPDLLFFPNLHFIGLSGRIPSVLTVHDCSFARFPEFYTAKSQLWHRLVQPRQLIDRVSHIIAVSTATKRDLVKLAFVDEKKVTVTHLDCAPEFHAQSETGTNTHARNRILLFGAHDARKNARGAVQAFRHFVATSPPGKDYVLTLIGNKERILRTMGTDIAALNCDVRESISRDDRLLLYRQAALLLYPSFAEGFGIPLLEAARSRVPIITANHSSIGEVIGGGALTIDPSNSRDIADAMHSILHDNELRTSLTDSAWEVAQRYSWSATARHTRDIFEYTYAHRN